MSRSAATPSGGEWWPEPFVVEWRDETGSTNADLVARARVGAPHGSVLVADHQRAGRGRLGRAWQAPPGAALLCSVLLRPPPGSVLHGAVWAVALAAQSAVGAEAGIAVELKWPNDLMVGPRKLAGVLAEGVTDATDPTRVAAVVVGIGLNVGWDAPPAEVAARAVTLEELCGRRVDRRVLLAALLRDLAPLLEDWVHRPDRLLARYREHLSTLGQEVRLTMADGDLEGTALDVTPAGELVVRASPIAGAGTRHVVSAADVVHLRPATS